MFDWAGTVFAISAKCTFAKGTPRAALVSIYLSTLANICFLIWSLGGGPRSILVLNILYFGLNLVALRRWTRWQKSPGRCKTCNR